MDRTTGIFDFQSLADEAPLGSVQIRDAELCGKCFECSDLLKGMLGWPNITGIPSFVGLSSGFTLLRILLCSRLDLLCLLAFLATSSSSAMLSRLVYRLMYRM